MSDKPIPQRAGKNAPANFVVLLLAAAAALAFAYFILGFDPFGWS